MYLSAWLLRSNQSEAARIQQAHAADSRVRGLYR